MVFAAEGQPGGEDRLRWVAGMPAPVRHGRPIEGARVRPRGLESPRLPARPAVAPALLNFFCGATSARREAPRGKALSATAVLVARRRKRPTWHRLEGVQREGGKESCVRWSRGQGRIYC